MTLESIAAFPVVTYHEGFTGRGNIDRSFSGAGIRPDIVLSAIDADVIKTYVEVGLGVGIIAEMAFNPAKDSGLRLIPVPDLFLRNTTRLALRRGHYLRSYAYRFIEGFVPDATEKSVSRQILQGVE